jgi:hypothetical protein
LQSTRLVILSVCIILGSALGMGQNNPVPLIYPSLQPMSTAPGGTSFTLTVYGDNFISGSTINWNGAALTTTYISNAQVTAVVPAANIAKAATAAVTVTSPTPGGGVSNVLYFTVTNPVTVFDFFDSVLPVNVAMTPYGVTGDFNGDGKLDLVYLDSSYTNVLVLLGNGDGTFQSPLSFPVGSGGNIIAADFNGDVKLDLAVTEGGDAVGILLGNGDGTFQPQIVVPTGMGPVGIAAADLNRDGKLDLAVATLALSQDSGFSILLGNGDGTFQTHTDYTFQTCYHNYGPPGYAGASAITAGDYNGDGILDIVATAASDLYCGGLMLFLGNGDGTFASPGPTPEFGIIADWLSPLAPPPLGVAAGPTTQFGAEAGYVGPLWTNSFSLWPDWQEQLGPMVGANGSAVGDFNGDGYIDVAFDSSLRGFSGTVPLTILPSSQSGSFRIAAVSAFPTLSGTIGLVAGDFNNDGKMDFASTINGQVSILLQGLYPVVAISPSSLSSNTSTNIGQTLPLTPPVTMMNGELALTISSITFSGPDAGDFTQTNNCGSLVAGGATCQIHVSFTPSAAGNRTATLNVNDNAQGSPQTVSLAGVGYAPPVPDFSLGFSPPSLTVAPGQVANYTLTVLSLNGFSGPVALTCSAGAPSSTCTITPSTVTVSNSATASVAIVTTAAGVGFRGPVMGPRHDSALAMWLPLSGTLGLVLLAGSAAGRVRRPRLLRGLLVLASLLSLGITWSACGGGSSPGNSGGGTAGTYNPVVTGTFKSGSTTLIHTTKLTLVVQ